MNLRNLLRSIQMLGVFGLILIAAVAIIGACVYNIVRYNDKLIEVDKLSYRRDTYQRTKFDMLDIQLYTRYAAYSDDPTAYDENFNADLEDIDYQILSLYDYATDAEESEDLSTVDITAAAAVMSQDELTTIDSLQAARDVMADLYPNISTAIMNSEDPFPLLEQSSTVVNGINNELQALIDTSALETEQKARELDMLHRTSVTIAIGGLMLFPLLALLAFVTASRVTHPILQMTNAVVAIGGNHYRRALLDEARRQGGGLSGLAREIDEMAQSVAAREAVLQQEIAQLREHLQENRRRKLVTTAGARPAGD